LQGGHDGDSQFVGQGHEHVGHVSGLGRFGREALARRGNEAGVVDVEDVQIVGVVEPLGLSHERRDRNALGVVDPHRILPPLAAQDVVGLPLLVGQLRLFQERVGDLDGCGQHLVDDLLLNRLQGEQGGPLAQANLVGHHPQNERRLAHARPGPNNGQARLEPRA